MRCCSGVYHVQHWQTPTVIFASLCEAHGAAEPARAMAGTTAERSTWHDGVDIVVSTEDVDGLPHIVLLFSPLKVLANTPHSEL